MQSKTHLVVVDLLGLMKLLLLFSVFLPILANNYPLTANDILVLVGGGRRVGHMMRMSKRDAEQGPKKNYLIRMSMRDDEQELMENFMIRINTREEEQGWKEDYMIRPSKRDEEWVPKEDYLMQVSKRDVYDWRPTEDYKDQTTRVGRLDGASWLRWLQAFIQTSNRMRSKGRKLVSRIGK